MATETDPAPERPLLPAEGFGFTEPETLYDRLSDARVQAILADPRTTVHSLSEGSNSYGDFLFITVSRPEGEGRVLVTFYGLGYHEHRERWYTDTWAWYRANPFPATLKQALDKAEVQEALDQRRLWLAPLVDDAPRSKRAQLYEMLADLTDEDGALAEIDDLAAIAGWLVGDDDWA